MNPTSLHRRSTSSWTSGALILLIACNGDRCGGPDDTGPDCDEADRNIYYQDLDGDGFGDGLERSEACVAPDGYVTNGDDCDDADPARIDMVPLWTDADGDGYGTGDAVQVCEGEPGYAGRDGDCDDGDGAVYPGASVVEGNGQDDDCDGFSDIDAPRGARDANDAEVRITGSAAGSLGYAVFSSGDLNDDGWPDLAVGAPDEDGAGTAYVFFGPLTEGAMAADEAALRYTGPSEGVAAGAAFLSGQFTEDGNQDLGVLCGDGFSSDGGASIYLLHGPVSSDGVLAASEEVTFVRSSGTSALDAADFVGADGALDLVGSFTSTSHEEVKLARGPFAESYDDDDDFYGILDTDDGDDLGAALAFVGDLSGDGVTDLAAGAPGESDNGADGEYRSDAGAVYIIDSPQIIRQNELADVTLRILGDVTDGMFGEAIAPAGDVDGDGAADLWVSAPSVNGDSGAVYLFSGSSIVAADDPFRVGPEDAAVTLEGTSDAGRFGARLAGNADANRDGVMDLVVAAPESNDGQGAVYLWYGPVTSGDVGDADLTLTGEGTGDRFGASISLRDDMNLLGNVDLVVGAPSANDGDGAAYVFFMDGL